MRKTRFWNIQRAADHVEEQRAWMRQRGSDLLGYIELYGAPDDPERYGDGGPAIYAADKAELERRQAVLARLRGD